MGNLKPFLLAALACLAISSGALAQQYVWQITRTSNDTGGCWYTYGWVDAYGTTCTASGRAIDTFFHTPGTPGRETILFFRSTDAGLTWVVQDPKLPLETFDNQPHINKVQQIDSLNAVGVGDSGLIVRTFDGGNTWQVQNLHSSGNVSDVHFSDSMTGIAILAKGPPTDAGDIETTHDGGKTWTLAPFSPWFFGANCRSDGGDKFRVISYQQGPVYSTTDDWASVDSTPLIVPLSDTTHVIGYFYFKGEDTIIGSGATYAGGYNGQDMTRLYLTRSTDGGMTWDSIVTPDTVSAHGEGMSELDNSIVILGTTGDDYIDVSTDHGMSWRFDTMYFDTSHRPELIGCITIASGGYAVAVFPSGSGPYGSLGRGEPVTSGVASNNEGGVGLRMYIYPNPSANSLTIDSSSGPLSITDPLGRCYELPVLSVAYEQPTRLDISSLPSGVYFVSDGISRAKFVKE